jgi:alkanesulfonate monooxygenase SsuD/methylene tetrahydromethanopterin reductase-like flavin-dependent oxidoreductase (luciferase family)
MSFVEHRSIAVTFTPTETRRDVIVEVAEAERLGYAAFFVAEGWAHDAVVLLAEIAARTERITLSAGVLNVWSRSAGLLAMAAVSLQEASGGRFVLGLDASSPQLVEGHGRVARRGRLDAGAHLLRGRQHRGPHRDTAGAAPAHDLLAAR